MNLLDPITTVKGVGPKTAAVLQQVGLGTVGDLIYCLPRLYENYQTAISIADLMPGKVIIKGQISDLKTIRTRRRNLTVTQGVIRDHSGAIRTVWFNQPYRAKQFDEKREYYFTGKYELKNGRYQLTSPAATLAQDVEVGGSTGFQPIYSAKSGLGPQTFQKLLLGLRPDFANIPDLLPMTSEKPAFLTPGARATALFNSHFPDAPADAEKARQYLAYEELFELILAAKLNQQANLRLRSLSLPFVAAQTKALVERLPFPLTGAQRRAAWEILQDLERTTPMNRLLQGDVGSGKTVVAALAAAQATAAGHQVALLAPTAILATQHYESLTKLFASLKTSATPNSGATPNSSAKASANSSSIKVPRLALLTGATRGKRQLKTAIKNGDLDLIIGTHALLTDDTLFRSLALCIIDEQHRFGVGQRQKLLLKSPDGTAPHLLSMTATPIPRSLQLTLFGDLDTSILNELPPGRQPITTKILAETDQRAELYPKMRKILKSGQQIYWICQLIDDAKTASFQSSANPSRVSKNSSTAPQKTATPVKTQVKKLQKLFPDYKVGLLHGKMSAAEKDQVMADFAQNKIHLLVSTTVVEVGVNVPNANMIIIQDAEGYGLAQLHQLRGRVGRGDQPASCYLLTTGDGRPSRRLREMEKSTDGFHLAEVDLKLRGPGEIYGSLQHGELNLQIASLTDTRLITAASRHAAEVAQQPKILRDYPELQRRIRKYQQLTTLN